MKGNGAHRRELWIPVIQCAWCRALRLGDSYLHVPRLGLLKGGWELTLPGFPPVVATFTHSVCKPCAREIRARAAARRAAYELSRRQPVA